MPEQKSEKPTPRRLRKARREGRTLKSRLLTETLVISAGLLGVRYGLGAVWVRAEKVISFFFAQGSDNLLYCLREAATAAFQVTAVTLSLVVLAGLSAELSQVGWRFHFSLLAAKASRLSIGAGGKKIFGGLAAIPWFLTRLLFAFLVLYLLLKSEFAVLPPALLIAPGMALQTALAFMQRVLVCMGALLVVFSALDYGWERRRFYRDLSMSPDEVRREQRESEGDPALKAYRRSLAQHCLYQDLVKKVRQSSVVVFKRN